MNQIRILFTDTAEMTNLNEKRKSESGIRMFNECDSTVWELRNPEDIGVAGMNMHLARFRERLGLSHAKKNVLRTNMWSIFLSTDDIVNKDKDRIKRNALISGG
jgi:hypothetical protein